MGVKVREKEKDSGIWWVFINYKGKRSSRQVGTKKAAEKAKEHIQARLKLGQAAFLEEKEPTLPTVQKFYDDTFKPLYLDNRGRIVESSAAMIKGNLATHFLPFFGEMALNHVENHIEEFFAELCDKAPSRIRKGTPADGAAKLKLSKNAIRTTRAYCRLFMTYAIRKYRKQGLTFNPFAGHEVGKLFQRARAPRPINPFTAAEAQLFLETARTTAPDYFPFFLLALKSGMRDGELAGLKPSDIDWQGKRIHVERSICRTTSGESTPKTESSTRWVKVSEEILTELRVHLVGIEEKFQMKGKPAPEYLFCTSTGHFVDVCNISARPWKRTLEAAGLSWRKIHETRHTYASILLNQGYPPTFVQKQLGHATVEMTLRIYAHHLPNNEAEDVMLRKLDSLLATQSAP